MNERSEYINEQVKKISGAMLKQEVAPSQASRFLNVLSALIGMARDEHLEREMSYNKILNDLMEESKTVTQAKSSSRTSDEYLHMRQSENKIETILEMLKTLKYTIKLATMEYKEAKY